MVQSQRLRTSDVAAVFTLVGECRELWADADAWHEHLVRGVSRLTGQAIGQYVEIGLAEPGSVLPTLVIADTGWRDEAARSHFLRFMSQSINPWDAIPGARRVLEACVAGGGSAAMMRTEFCEDAQWYRSEFFNEYRRRAFNDAMTISLAHHRDLSVQSMLGAHQDLSDPAPTRRTREIVSLLHRRIAPLVGTVLARDGQLGLHGLPPRLRQVLQCLLQGDGEKQVALQLGLTQATVHEYVGRLYRRFGVQSRGELLAYFIRRQPRQPDANGPPTRPAGKQPR